MFKVSLSKRTFYLPGSVSELTLGQFLDLRNPENADIVSRLAILLKIDVAEITDISYTTKQQREVDNLCNLTEVINQSLKDYFATDESIRKLKTVTILGETYRVPNAERAAYWPSRKVKEIIQEQIEKTGKSEFDATDRMDEIIAHYMYSEVTGKPYNEIEADNFRHVIRDMALVEAVPLANFFILRWLTCWTTRRKSWFIKLAIWKRRLGLKGSAYTEM